MNTDSSYTKSPRDIFKPEKMSKSFQDISKYFSEEEWENLTKWQKSAYVFMKRNYIRMTGLGVTVNKPVFMRGKDQITEFLLKESDEGLDHESEGEHSKWTFGMAHTKGLKIQKETSWKRNCRKRVPGAHGSGRAQRCLHTQAREMATGPKRSHESSRKKERFQKRKHALIFDVSSDEEENY
ncbi:protein SSX1-like [Mus caroli]|uniref:Protein SSX1-like n=1 Tax=Mus caroli TaxID=10089 RepID=A0A6P5PA43_MUSCR|nr:protein SSX1-like [Mus caroli]